MNDAAAGTATPPSFRYYALHLLTLWSVAVAQPLFEIVRRNREFFVAHRAEPLDLLLLVLVISVVLPGMAAAAVGAATLAWRRAGHALLLVVVAILVAAVAAQPLARYASLGTTGHFAVAGAIGIGGAWLYASASAARLFVTVLSPAIVVFPAFLLLHPEMATFVRPDDRTEQAAGTIGGTPPPVVLVVFDQLPLTSLMTADGEIDAANFPGFGALASQATWYRNATTVADYTGFALPPILTGLRPRARHLPTADDYPQNLFTFLAGTYRLEVFEAITGLCPQRLCGREPTSASRRVASMTLDLAVVYLHVVLPAGERAALPPLTDDWKNFAQGQNWHRRWIAERDDDRRRAPRQFVDAIEAGDPQPTFYFLHALLPHEPYVYLPSGQRFTEAPKLTGLDGERWTSEEWAVAEQYRRHLIQLRYVDGLLGGILDRLRGEGLYERALVIVTADHGVSFKPGASFKSVRPSTLEDIMPVPLFIKLPGQHQGRVSDLNIESPDIVPTIADVLGAPLTWPPDGRSARQSGARPAAKTIHHTGARREIAISVEELVERRRQAVARKVGLFGRGENPLWLPTTAPYRELIGRPLTSLPVDDKSSLEVLVRDAVRLRHVVLDAELLPVELTGRVVDGGGAPAQATIAVALNGTIAATARTFGFLPGNAAANWTALVAPRYLQAGANDLDVFVVSGARHAVRLERAFTSSSRRPAALNLASRAARDYWGVQQSGLHEPEGAPIPYRWTEGEAVVVAPLDRDSRPKSLRVGIAHTAGGRLRIELNACTVFDDVVSDTPWYRTFALADCPASTLRGSEARIVLRSATHVREGEGSRRTVGVAVEAINLFAWDWPLAPQPGPSRLSARPVLGSDAPHVRGSGAPVELTNRGATVLLSPLDSGGSGVDLELRWNGARDTTQRLALPRTLYPTEQLTMELPLMPPPELEGQGPWTLHVVPVRRDGRPVILDAPCTVRVVPEEDP